jgi:hypothetical protein
VTPEPGARPFASEGGGDESAMFLRGFCSDRHQAHLAQGGTAI